MAIKMSPMKFELDAEAINKALLAVVTEAGVSLDDKHTRITFRKKDGANVAVIEVSTEPFLEVQRDPNAPKRGRKPKAAAVAEVAEAVEAGTTEEEVVEEEQAPAPAQAPKAKTKKPLFNE